MRKGWGDDKITKFTEKTLPIFKTPWMTVHDFWNRNSRSSPPAFDDLSGRHPSFLASRYAAQASRFDGFAAKRRWKIPPSPCKPGTSKHGFFFIFIFLRRTWDFVWVSRHLVISMFTRKWIQIFFVMVRCSPVTRTQRLVGLGPVSSWSRVVLWNMPGTLNLKFPPGQPAWSYCCGVYLGGWVPS